jgi:hypothetical protein
MVDNSNNHLKETLLRQRVKCAAKHIDIELYVVKEKIRNHNESVEPISIKQMVTDPFTKAYHPVCSENAQSTWVLWYSL